MLLPRPESQSHPIGSSYRVRQWHTIPAFLLSVHSVLRKKVQVQTALERPIPANPAPLSNPSSTSLKTPRLPQGVLQRDRFDQRRIRLAIRHRVVPSRSWMSAVVPREKPLQKRQSQQPLKRPPGCSDLPAPAPQSSAPFPDQSG